MNDFHQEVCERIDQIVDSTSQGRLTGLVGDANSQKQEIAKIMLYSQTYNKADTLLRVGDKAVVMEALDNLEGKLKQGAKLDQNNIKEIKQDAKKALNKVTPSQHRQEPG
jgi:ABC-type antimicrobial peptide transport system ATPase subunit